MMTRFDERATGGSGRRIPIIPSAEPGGATIDALLSARALEKGSRPLGLYVHIPFCASKCHFCDWVIDIPVQQLRQQQEERRPYIDALCKQIRHYGPQLVRAGYCPDLMYWGGGTPGRLAPDEMLAIHRTLKESLDLSTLQEWTVETTPSDVSPVMLETLGRIGVSRISMGVQSFDSAQLRAAGRAHSVEDARRALRMLPEHGFDNFNIDLILGFPGENIERMLASVDEALAFAPRHISLYPFRATPKTVMALQLQRKRLDKTPLEQMLEVNEQAALKMTRAGYHEYSHGYWVKDADYEDRDANYTYGMVGDRIGFGSGADSIICGHFLRNEKSNYAGFLESPWFFDQVKRFSSRSPGMFVNHLGGALMTKGGINFERFRNLTGVPFSELRATPQLDAWLDFLRHCGAEFVETSEALKISESSKHLTYLAQLVGTVG